MGDYQARFCEKGGWKSLFLLDRQLRQGSEADADLAEKAEARSELVVMYPSETLSDPIFRVYKNFK